MMSTFNVKNKIEFILDEKFCDITNLEVFSM